MAAILSRGSELIFYIIVQQPIVLFIEELSSGSAHRR